MNNSKDNIDVNLAITELLARDSATVGRVPRGLPVPRVFL